MREAWRRIGRTGFLAGVCAAGCSGGGDAPSAAAPPPAGVAGQPAGTTTPSAPTTTQPGGPAGARPLAAEVFVRQVLVGYAGAVGGPPGMVRTKAEAQALAARIRDAARAAGADFAAVASSHLPPGEAQSALQVGQLARAQIRPEFQAPLEPVFRLAAGEVSDVLEIGPGLFVFKREPDPPVPQRGANEPDHITVDHILVAVRNARMPTQRTADEARKRAESVLARVKAGEDWAALKREFSDDPPPGGPYGMANHGVEVRPGGEFKRGGMVPAFGNVGFRLAVGEVGLAEHHEQTSPFGFHIIKRTE